MKSPSNFAGVLGAELQELGARRCALFPNQQPLPHAPEADHPYVQAHRLRAFGMCLSGGGIRSATFNLGVLQGLAELGLLPYLDYLSTVSGGGYIGSWLHGLIRNTYRGDPVAAQQALLPTRVPGQSSHDPISFLRKYSNYLAPQVGLFSPDFWTIGSVWIRNMSLNLAILIPFLIGVVLTVLMAGLLQQRFSQGLEAELARTLWAFALAFAVPIVGCNLRQIVFDQFPELTPRWELPDLSGRGFVGGATLCIMFAAYILGAFRFDPHPVGSGVLLFILFFLLQWVGGFRLCYSKRHAGSNGWAFLLAIPFVSAALTATLLWYVWTLTSAWDRPDSDWLRIAFGPVLILVVWMCGTTLQVGLMGSDYPDAAREWMASLGASVSIAITGWVGLFVLAVFGPYWLATVTLRWAPLGVTLAGGWILSGIGGYLSGKSARSKGGAAEGEWDGRTWALEVLATVAPFLFLAGFLLFVSLGTHLLLRAIAGSMGIQANCVVPSVEGVPQWLLWLEPVKHEYWCFLYYANQPLLFTGMALLAACGVIIGLLPLRININEFSMHHFYKNRLVRCYLGAGRHQRLPNRLTGFDPHDDFPIAALVPSHPVVPYRGPYPIVNCALNLNTGSELAKQERRATSFVFTPRYCGFDPPYSREDQAAASSSSDLKTEGYRATAGYMEPAGPGLGTAMAISGAAANPNSGYHTSAPLAFLMTILNVRLGWWLGNPRRDTPSARPGPKNALAALLSELFAQSNGRSRYINVSDGGHFDNLGLYELVRRRCRYIVVSDSEADPGLKFEGLGGAIRKCRADFGVEITLDPDPIRLNQGVSRAHCVVGTVTYPEVEAGFAADACGTPDCKVPQRATGWLLYLKSSFTGDEPEDVQQYRAGYGAFPHESTADQFFTESQFESYRQLGLHVVRTTFENVRQRPSGADEKELLSMFQELCRKWHPAPTSAEGADSDLTEQYSAFLQRIAGDPELAFLDNQLFDGMAKVEQPKVTPRKAVYFCMELIQFMEDVYFELNFPHKRDRENPVYAGWTRVFRTWANSKAIGAAWEVAGDGYNPLFREYFEELRK
ncbi:MAG: hypothetical protein ABI759_09790 [Candidatus Solibacter sp.]